MSEPPDDPPSATGPDEADALFRDFARTRDRRTRNRLVEMHMGLARYLVSRYRRPGIGDDDILQVALLGLVKSVDRFDVDRGVAFSTFAGRTIEGELKRHFRDTTWALRVPRSVKDLHVSVRRASEEMEQQLGRSPTVGELAEYLDVSRDAVVGSLGAAAAQHPASLDAPIDAVPMDHLAALARPATAVSVDERDQVERLLSVLGPREQEIVRLRFYENLTQDEIAERVGLSQMHVSRLLRQSFDAMRASSS